VKSRLLDIIFPESKLLATGVYLVYTCLIAGLIMLGLYGAYVLGSNVAYLVMRLCVGK
jgi:hypothetical protein